MNYSPKRFAIEAECLLNSSEIDEETAKKLLFTKFSHWRYENEVRGFVTLEDRDPETNLYFADFSDRLKLAQVIVGARSDLTRTALREALGSLVDTVEAFKARLAFGSFRVVRQRDKKLWTYGRVHKGYRMRFSELFGIADVRDTEWFGYCQLKSLKA